MFNRRTARAKLAAIAKVLSDVSARSGDPRYAALGDILADTSSPRAFALDVEEARLVVVALDLYNVLGDNPVHDQAVADLFGECEKAYLKTYGQKWA
jgi:hypothetical protein